jgi:dTDP-D-glucose 4,6-dehydratase
MRESCCPLTAGIFVSLDIRNELGWKPEESFDTGIRKTVQWYLDNQKWVERVTSGKYRMQRLGNLEDTKEGAKQ